MKSWVAEPERVLSPEMAEKIKGIAERGDSRPNRKHIEGEHCNDS